MKSHNIGKVGKVNVDPVMSGDVLFRLLVQKFQIVFEGYLNLLGMVREVKAWSVAYALWMLLLGYESGSPAACS